MKLFKKKITEMQAATLIVDSIIKDIKGSWATIFEDFKETWGNNFIIEDEEISMYDFSLAITSLEMQSVANLFPKEQAERIYRWILCFIGSSEKYEEYSKAEIKKYEEVFLKSIKKAEIPTGQISVLLLHRWLGKNIKKFTDENTGIISPTLITHVMKYLVSFIGYTKKIINRYKIIESEMTPELMKELENQEKDH